MGRPLNKKFFGDGSGLLSCTAWFERAGGTSSVAFILRQRSNSKYEVADETTTASNALIVGSKYEIVTVGTGTWADAGASAETIGTRFTATATTNGQADGTAREIVIGKVQQAAPAATGELQIAVTPELVGAASDATFTIDTDGSGAVSAVAITGGGTGYFETGGTFTITDLTLTGNDDAVITYTVDLATQSIDTATVTTPGTGYTINQSGVAVNAADIPDAGASDQTARIINAHHVKTFEGLTLAWPAAGGAGSGGRGIFNEGDIETQA